MSAEIVEAISQSADQELRDGDGEQREKAPEPLPAVESAPQTGHDGHEVDAEERQQSGRRVRAEPITDPAPE